MSQPQFAKLKLQTFGTVAFGAGFGWGNLAYNVWQTGRTSPVSYAGSIGLVMVYLPYTFRSHRKLHRNVGFKYSLRPMDPSWETALHSTPPLFTCILYFTFCLTASLQRKFHGVKTFPPPSSPPAIHFQSSGRVLHYSSYNQPAGNQMPQRTRNGRIQDALWDWNIYPAISFCLDLWDR